MAVFGGVKGNGRTPPKLMTQHHREAKEELHATQSSTTMVGAPSLSLSLSQPLAAKPGSR